MREVKSDIADICSKLHDWSSRKLHSDADRFWWHSLGMDARERIRRYIDGNPNLSLANVAKKAGLSNSALQKYVTGKVRSMTLENIENIARAMDVSPRWVIFGDGHPEVENVWDRIPERRKKQALRVLETFTDGTDVTDVDGTDG